MWPTRATHAVRAAPARAHGLPEHSTPKEHLGQRPNAIAAVEQWASKDARVRLRWLDSGHELLDQLETMWTETAAFFGLA